MEPLEFLTAVLPPPGYGYYCAAELSSPKKTHVFVESLNEIQPRAEAWLQDKRDIYFALATFDERGKRTADNAEYLRSLFIDMDGYASKKDAAQALDGFLADTGLDSCGTPWVVASGGGLHCYWAFEHPVPVGMWKPVAEGLKRLCKQQGLNIDMTVTADAARVLRIPGTLNFKKKYATPRPVKVLVPVYGGPASGGNTARETFVTPSPITELGFIVVNVDSRAAPGMGKRINMVMQACFFALSGVLPRTEAIAQISRSPSSRQPTTQSW